MSVASASRTIKFISKGGTYTAVIMSPEGDLYQDYEGDGTPGSTASISPDYASLKPVLYFVCTSSRQAEGVATPVGMRYYCNGVEITFSGATSSNFNGAFERVSPSGDNPYYGLKIVKNLADLCNYAPVTIRMTAMLSYGTQTDNIQASYIIPVQKATGSSYHVTIAAGDAKNFVISDKDDSCIMQAKVWQGGSLLSSGLTYVWQQLSQSGWTDIAMATAATLTVGASMVDTYGEFRVVVSKSGAVIGSDVQSVMDVSDPYDIEPHPVPEDETIEEDVTPAPGTDRGTVTYTPVVVKRGQTGSALDTLFFFVVKDAVGNILNPGEYQTARASCTVTRAQCMQAGGDVSVAIITES